MAVAKDATYHPVRDYLGGLTWDGKRRLKGFAQTYLGAEGSEYHDNICRCFFIGAVARIKVPGCKHDHMLILEGEQNEGKSTVAQRLFDPWYTDDMAELGTKDSQMQIRGAWGVEVAELSSMTRGEVERVKAFVSRRTDRFRPSYGRHVIEVDRQAVFIGTTNADVYLKDETGGRRYWPLRCGRINLKAIADDRDQLWAEAVHRYEAGEAWWFKADHDVIQARVEQSARYSEDPWQDGIAQYLKAKTDLLARHLSGRNSGKSSRHRPSEVDADRAEPHRTYPQEAWVGKVSHQ